MRGFMRKVSSTAVLALNARGKDKNRMLAREQQKQIPVGIRNFRSTAGLSLPSLPCQRRDADEVCGLAGRQTGRLSGGADGGGVAHGNGPFGPATPRVTGPNRCRPHMRAGRLPKKPTARWPRLCASVCPETSIRDWFRRASAASRRTTRDNAFSIFMAYPLKTGPRNAALWESLYPLDIDCQEAQEVFLRANA